MHKQHPQTAYRKAAVLIGTIFENCDKIKSGPPAAPKVRRAVFFIKERGTTVVYITGGQITLVSSELCFE
jgi:phosphoserine phosphatase